LLEHLSAIGRDLFPDGGEHLPALPSGDTRTGT
jgi:hypothetical protein